MKKFVIKTLKFSLFFLLFSLILNAVYLLTIAKTDWDFIKRLETLNWDNPDYELLALGTSLCEYGIDTELLSSKGIKSYNFSLVGSSIKTNSIQLEEYLRKYSSKPKYVLLVNNSHLERFDQEGIQPVVEFTMKGHSYSFKDVPVSKFGWAGMELLKKFLFKEYRMTKVANGFKKSIRVEPDYSEYNNLYIDTMKYRNAFWIGKIAKLCSENKIELILVDIPGVNATQNLSAIGPYIINFNNGCSAKLYNFNSREFCSFIDNEKDWSGLSHFNKYGALKFTTKLIDITLIGKSVAK